MATVAGGLFHASSPTAPVTAGPRPDAGPLSLSAVAGAHATVGGSASTSSSGFDTVSGPQAGGGFAGNLPAGTDQVVATQTVEGGNTVLHLPDGSTITLIGVTHVDSSFVH
jgi:hypothetical protein